MSKIEITWVREPHPSVKDDVRSEVAVDLVHEFNTVDHTQILNAIYRDTNLYSGAFWNALEPVMPSNRSHTALSVGDFVQIDEDKYVVADFGFDLVN